MTARRRSWLDWLRETDLVALAWEVGFAIFILVTFVRCAIE